MADALWKINARQHVPNAYTGFILSSHQSRQLYRMGSMRPQGQFETVALRIPIKETNTTSPYLNVSVIRIITDVTSYDGRGELLAMEHVLPISIV